MPKIYVNNKVFNAYRDGLTINEALNEVYGDVIAERRENEPVIKDLSPLQIVMKDAGISKKSTVGEIMNASSTYTSNGMSDGNDWLFPVWVEETLRQKTLDTDLLPYVVGATQSIDSNIVKTAMLDFGTDKNKKAIKKARVAEAADLPIAKIVIGESALSLWKHGRAIQVTYEAMRRMKIELFQLHMNAIANDLAHQEFDWAVDAIVNGDGNSGSEPVKIGTTAASTITRDELIGFAMDYSDRNHVPVDTILAGEEMFRVIAGMTFDNSLVSGASNKVTINTPQFPTQTLQLLRVKDMPKIGNKNAIVLLNRANTVIKYVENGSMIQETQNFIQNQTRLMTISENSAYGIMTAGMNAYIEVGTAASGA